MARIKGKDLYLKNDDQIYFGDNKEAAIWFENNDLILNHTISGVDPVLPGHLVTKRYLENNTAIDFLELTDTPTTYSGNAGYVLRVNDAEDGVEFAGLSVHGMLQFSENPTFNGLMHIIGWYEQMDSAVSLSSGSPITPSKAGFNSHFVMDISNVAGAPFTITVSGTVVDDDYGTYSTISEPITISGAAYYQTEGLFIDIPTISIVEAAKSCTMDIYKAAYWNYGEKDFTVTGCIIDWTPDQNNWYIDFRICHQLSDGSLSSIEHVVFDNTDTCPRAASGEPGRYHRTDYNTFVEGSKHAGIRVCIDQSGIGNFYVELRYDSTGE
jgi:hypothetical protein